MLFCAVKVFLGRNGAHSLNRNLTKIIALCVITYLFQAQEKFALYRKGFTKCNVFCPKALN